MHSFNAARHVPSDEIDLRTQRAHELGASDARHLRLVARNVENEEMEGTIELPGVDAERLRLLAAKLEDDECEIASLREHATSVHRALCEAIEELGDDDDEAALCFVFISDATPFAPTDGLTLEQFGDLAVFLLDEIE